MTIIFAAFDAMEEAKDIIPTARRMSILDLMCSVCRDKFEKNSKREVKDKSAEEHDVSKIVVANETNVF